MISEPNFTNFTASYLSINLLVIPTPKPTLPSLLANITTIPSPNSFLPLSTNFLKSLAANL